MSGKSDEKYRLVRKMGVAMTIPMVLLAGPLIGWFIGSWLDKKFEATPWFVMIFSILGFIAGVRQTYRLIKELNRDD